MKKIIVIIVLALVLVVVGVFIYIKATAADVGEKAPEITATLLDGTKFELSELRGEYVVLNFWGSWCGPCRAESPDLVKLQDTYSDKMTLVSIALEKDGEDGRLVSKLDGYKWKHQIIEETSLLFLSQHARDYGVASIPSTFLISPDGVILEPRALHEISMFLSEL